MYVYIPMKSWTRSRQWTYYSLPRKVSFVMPPFWPSNTLLQVTRQAVICTLSLQISLHFYELNVNAIIDYVLFFNVASFTQCIWNSSILLYVSKYLPSYCWIVFHFMDIIYLSNSAVSGHWVASSFWLLQQSCCEYLCTINIGFHLPWVNT